MDSFCRRLSAHRHEGKGLTYTPACTHLLPSAADQGSECRPVMAAQVSAVKSPPRSALPCCRKTSWSLEPKGGEAAVLEHGRRICCFYIGRFIHPKGINDSVDIPGWGSGWCEGQSASQGRLPACCQELRPVLSEFCLQGCPGGLSETFQMLGKAL